MKMAEQFNSTPPTCPHCNDVFKDPRILACFHTFCLSCLKTFICEHLGKQSITCPLCCVESDIPNGGISSLEINRYLRNERSLTKQSTVGDTCEICDVDADAQVYCLECDQCFCKPCIKFHQRMKLFSSHSVFPICQKETTRRTRKLVCTRHFQEQLKFMCCKCNLPICLSCKLTEHENHSTQSLDEVADTSRRQMEEVFDEEFLKSKIKTLLSRNNVLGSLKTAMKEMKSREIERIHQRERELQQKVHQSLEETISEVESYFLEEQRKLEEEENTIDLYVQSIVSLRTTGVRMISYATNAEIAQRGNKLYSRMTDTIEMVESMAASVYTPKLSFQSKDVDVSTMQRLFGTIRRGGFSKKPSLLSSFTTHSNDWIYGLCTTTHGRCWVSTGDEAVILSNSQGREIKKIDVNMNNLYLAGDSRGNLFISCYYDNCIHVFTHCGSLKKFATLPFGPRGISINDTTGDVIVCSDDALYKLSESGEVNRVDFNGDTYFAVAVDVAVNKNGEICVSDRRQKTLFIFTGDCDYKASYMGDNESLTSFDPCGICVDHTGNFIVADFSSKMIHVVDHCGQCLQTFTTAEYCEGSPFSVSADTLGRLWVGFNCGQVCVLGPTESANGEMQ